MVASPVAKDRRIAGPIATSRLLVGILLHFCVPAYLLVSLASCFLVAPSVDDFGDAVTRMMWTALWFVPGFLLVTGVAAGVGTVLDRRRVRSPDTAEMAREQVAAARRLLAPLHNARMGEALTSIDAASWDFADARYQGIARDLEAAARTFFAAARSAAPGGRPAIVELAADSVERLSTALVELGDVRRRLDEGDARTVASYLDARYGRGA